MSDGPHKSLPLRPKYRRVAEWAYKSAFAIPEVCEAAESALVQDANMELRGVIKQLVDIVEGSDLFSRQPDELQRQLYELRDDPAVHPLAASAIECIQMAVQEGLQGRDAVQSGIATALSERLDANARTTEEHYLAERGPGAGRTIRNRMGEVSAGMHENGSFTRIARSLLGDGTVAITRTPAVRDGLDEGVSL
ncbi:hypothetical protein FJ936_09175 [Mesorhizobium sp. B2-4-13]|uniref:hypothetical protein n=1 Tax=Mesorhizobium sp. B2-4-13 TaxID=2589936 RepID=UPI00114F8ABE|nr:hypothetical protein [Mesorhizobium sp. B2-4-13]TPK85700.1 hypothetical protein FJ936_09175 [Mesorhizobium sp. B2-4-13]